MSSGNVSRRDVLVGLGAAGLGTVTTGLATADVGANREYNVGIATPGGERATRRAADAVSRTLDWGDGTKTLTVALPDEAVDGLRQRPDVRYVEVNGAMHAISQTLPWGIDRVDADVVHANGETGGDNTDGEGGADVAIIDTGIDDDHPDLQANIGAGKSFVKCRGPNCNYAWSDDNDHGTHCAGIADAIDNTTGVVGVSTAATLHAVKVLDKRGSGSFSDVAAGIKYVADQGWDVGSMSLGASSGSQTVKDACGYAYDRGVLLVAAAGNDGPCSDCVGYPAAYAEVIAVSSIDSDDGLSSFSSTGPEVELAAPGGQIYSTVIGGYDTFSGTSMACPHVSGAGAQLMDNGYTNTEARDQLASSAEDLGLSTNEQGNGLLDVEAALGGSSGSTDSAPTISWVNPSDGETVSGSVAVQIDASDSEDSAGTLDVTYSVDGGSARSTSYNSTSGYYEDTWDTTGVSDGGHTLDAAATDSAGNTTTASISVTTDNGSTSNSAPSASIDGVTDNSNPAWDRFTVDWSASDADGNLATVEVELLDASGTALDSVTNTVSGSSASGSNEVKSKSNAASVRVTATDSAGSTGSDSRSV